MSAKGVGQLAAPALFEQCAGTGAALDRPIEAGGELAAFGCCNHIGYDHEAKVVKLRPICFSGSGFSHFQGSVSVRPWVKTALLTHIWFPPIRDQAASVSAETSYLIRTRPRAAESQIAPKTARRVACGRSAATKRSSG